MPEPEPDAADQVTRWPLEVGLSMIGSLLVGLGGGTLSLVYLVVGLSFGGGAHIALLAVLLSAGFVSSAFQLAHREPAGRIVLAVAGVCFIPALPAFVSTFVEYVGDPDPIWWVVSTVIAVVVVVPAWLPGANRWFASERPT